jgi:DNA primase
MRKGHKCVDMHDWSSLRGRKAIIWPDADKPGNDAADDLTPILLDQECSVWTIDVTGYPEGWDCYDAIHGPEYRVDLRSIRIPGAGKYLNHSLP